MSARPRLCRLLKLTLNFAGKWETPEKDERRKENERDKVTEGKGEKERVKKNNLLYTTPMV